MNDIENMCVDFIDDENQSQDEELIVKYDDDKSESSISSNLDNKININLKSLNNSPIKSFDINDIKSTFQTSKNIDINSYKFEHLINKKDSIIEEDQESVEFNHQKDQIKKKQEESLAENIDYDKNNIISIMESNINYDKSNNIKETPRITS